MTMDPIVRDTLIAQLDWTRADLARVRRLAENLTEDLAKANERINELDKADKVLTEALESAGFTVERAA